MGKRTNRLPKSVPENALRRLLPETVQSFYVCCTPAKTYGTCRACQSVCGKTSQRANCRVRHDVIKGIKIFTQWLSSISTDDYCLSRLCHDGSKEQRVK
ncbi:hypothetical protein BaRGS_00029273 [Batillaria attramentaria]|uniref:Uncharacterized protein n=1 Tax=Batillaria attramentaria TaxID=370345 RepID=A0ABD0JWU5_9CAEN